MRKIDDFEVKELQVAILEVEVTSDAAEVIWEKVNAERILILSILNEKYFSLMEINLRQRWSLIRLRFLALGWPSVGVQTWKDRDGKTRTSSQAVDQKYFSSRRRGVHVSP